MALGPRLPTKPKIPGRDHRFDDPVEIAAFKKRVAEMKAEGLVASEIARILGIAPVTLHRRLRA